MHTVGVLFACVTTTPDSVMDNGEIHIFEL